MSSKEEQYRRQAEEWTERAYADPGAYLAHRAELIASLGTPLERGDTVLDLACGDAGLGEALLARGLAYRGVDSTAEMVEQARRRLGERAVVDLGDLNDYVPPEPRGGDHGLPRDLLRPRPTTPSSRTSRRSRRRSSSSTSTRASTACEDVLDDLAAAGFAPVELRPFFVPQTVSPARPWLSAAAEALEAVRPARPARAAVPVHVRRRRARGGRR